MNLLRTGIVLTDSFIFMFNKGHEMYKDVFILEGARVGEGQHLWMKGHCQ